MTLTTESQKKKLPPQAPNKNNNICLFVYILSKIE